MHAAHKIDQGDEARVEISTIKFFGAKVLHDVIDRAIQVHGARGVTGDTPLERCTATPRAARIYDGPDEVHRMVVARRDPEGYAPAMAGVPLTSSCRRSSSGFSTRTASARARSRTARSVTATRT